MKNLMVAGNGNGAVQGTNTTRYVHLTGDSNGAVVEAGVQMRVRDSLTWANLRAYIEINSFASGNNVTITARVNGAGNTTLQLVINGGTTGEVEDLTGSISLVSGDLVAWESVTPNVAGNLEWDWISCTLDGNVGYFQTSGGTRVTLAASTTYYSPPDGALINGGWTTEAWAQMATRETVTIDRLRGYLSTNGTGGSLTVRTRKNGANGNGVIVWTGTTGEQEDTSNTDSFADTDLLSVSLANTNTAGTTSFAGFQLRHNGAQSFLGTINQQGNQVNSALTRDIVPEGDMGAGATVEAQTQVDATVTRVIKNMRVYLSANTINGTSTFTLRKDGVNTAMAVSFGNAVSGLQEDLVDSVTFTAAEEISTRLVTGGSMNSMTPRYIQYTQQDEVIADIIQSTSVPLIDEAYDEEHEYNGFVAWQVPEDIPPDESIRQEWPLIDETYDEEHEYNGFVTWQVPGDVLPPYESIRQEWPLIDEAYDEEHEYNGFVTWQVPGDVFPDESIRQEWPFVDETYDSAHNYTGWAMPPMRADNPEVRPLELPYVDETYAEEHDYSGYVTWQMPEDLVVEDFQPLAELPYIDESYDEEHDYSGLASWQMPEDVVEPYRLPEATQIDETYDKEYNYDGFATWQMPPDVADFQPLAELPQVDETYDEEHSYDGFATWQMPPDVLVLQPLAAENTQIDGAYLQEFNYSGFQLAPIRADVSPVPLHSLRRRLALNSSRDNQVLHADKQDYNIRSSRR